MNKQQQKDLENIVTEFATQGSILLPGLISRDICEKIVRELGSRGAHYVNQNKPTGVWANNQYFDTFALAKNKNVFDLICSPFVEHFCSKYLGDYLLKCHRYYETYTDHKMPWHTDAKNQTSGLDISIPGVVFLVYLEDTFDGEFQAIRGSHKNNFDLPFAEFYDDSMVEIKYGEKITSYPGIAGSVAIQETRAIHRAKPFVNNSDPLFSRKTLFFQIDQYPNNVEPIYLNSKWLNINSPHQNKLFRLGDETIQVENPHPATNIHTWDQKRFTLLG